MSTRFILALSCPSVCAGVPTREPRPATPGASIPPYPRRAAVRRSPRRSCPTPATSRQNTPQTGIRGCHTVNQKPANPCKQRHDAPRTPIVTRLSQDYARKSPVKPPKSADRPSNDKPVPARLCGDTPKAMPRHDAQERPSAASVAFGRNRARQTPCEGVEGRFRASGGISWHCPALPGGLRRTCARDPSAFARAGPPRRTNPHEMGIYSPLQNISASMMRPCQCPTRAASSRSADNRRGSCCRSQPHLQPQAHPFRGACCSCEL